MANIATITNNIISALSGTTSQVLLGDATLTDFKLDSLTDVSVPTPGDGDVLKWNATLSLWEASDAAGITGSGTTNYIAKFTPNGGTLGNSQIFDNGTNVGINTASPTSKLTVNGSFLATTSGVGLEYNSGILYHGGSYYQFPSGGYYLLYGRTGMGLIFGSNNAEVGRFDLSGNLGIGTTTPRQKLDVSGNITTIWGSNVFIGMQYQDGTQYRNGFLLNDSTRSTGIIAQVPASDTGATPYIWFATGVTPTERMRITSSGFVGIGTTAPQTALDVSGSLRVSGTGGTGFFTGSNVILETPIAWANIGGSAFQIRNTTSLGLVFGAATSQLMTLTTTGNLGIGITAPTRRLQINEASANTVALAITNSSTTVNGFQLIVDGSGGAALWNYSNTSLSFGTNNNDRMMITNAGNVGIGTTAPTQKLTVYGGNANGQIKVGFADNANWELGRDNSVTGDFVLTNNISGFVIEGLRVKQSTARVIIGGGSDTGEKLQVTGTAKITGAVTFGTLALGTGLYWDNTNNRLGIGHSAPATQLHLRNATGAIVTIESTNAGSVATPVETSINFNGYGANLQAQISLQDKQANLAGGWLLFRVKDASNALQDRLIIDRSGFVGIGTTSPSQTLHVSGNSLIVGGATWTTGVVATQFFGDIYGSIKYDYNTTNFTINSYGLFSIATNGTSPTTKFTVTAAGNVGIGTSAPAVKLHVVGTTTNSTIVPILIGTQVGSGPDTGTSIRLGYSDTAGAYAQIGGAYANAGTYLNFSTSPDNSTAAVERMRITNSGNVGIGTTAPTTSLVVRGNTSGYDKNIIVWERATDGAVQGTLGFGKSVGAASENNVYVGSITAHPLLLQTNNVERLRITATGDVGIGTSSPDLTDWSASANGLQINDSIWSVLKLTGSTGKFWLASGSVGTYIYQFDANPLYFGTNNTERMRISATGDVGIGTTTPSGKFEVTGGASGTGVASYFSAYTGYSAPNPGNAAIPGGAKIVLWNNTGGQRAYIGMDASADIWFNNAGLQAGAGFTFYTGDGLSATPLPRLKITKSGFIGIGQSSPTFLLDVNGDALINGVRVGKGPNSLSGNTVLGASALNGVTTGTNNVAIGPNAIDGTTTGNYNIAIGFLAGGIGANENTTGSSNIFIGTEAQGLSSTESNRTWIGSNTTVATWLGGNLLVGTKTNSTHRLDVVGTTRLSSTLLVGGVTTLTNLAGTGTRIVVTDASGNLSTQPTDTYLTSLTGEATNSGSVVTLTNSAVIGKLLTGLNITSASIAATDSILAAFGKIQGQIDGLQGGTIYKGSWNASTNTPTITSGTGTQGNYYVVTTAGTTTIDGVSSWAIGDWIIYNGTVWEKIPNVDAITSVNGQTGVVSLTTSNISEGTNLYYTDARARAAISLTTSGASGASTYSAGVLNIPTYTLAGLGGVATGTTITINGVAQDLSTNRTYSVGTVTSIVAGSYLTGGTITGSGTIAVDATTTNTADKIVARDASGNFSAGTITATLTGTASNATTAGGLSVHADRNNEVNKIVRTDANGYIQAGWINTTSGDNGTTAIDRIYASSDAYLRYYTPANFRTVLDVPTRTGGSASGTWAISVTGNAATATNVAYSGLTGTVPTWNQNTTGNAATASTSSQVTINYSNNSDASYQMLWGSGNSVYGTAGITCNPFTDTVNLTGTINSAGIGVVGFGRMYGGDFWHSGTANNGTRTPTLKLGRFSDSETPAYIVYTNDTEADTLEFFSERYVGDFRLTRNSDTGLRNMMRVNSDNGGSVIDLYTGDGSSLGAKIQSNGDARFAYDVVAYYSFSDARLKTNVLTIENPLQKVMAMRGVSYEWLEGHKKGKKEIGLIAQEVMEIIPEVVSEKERIDGSKFLSVDYEHLTGLLIEAVKELKKEVDELKSK
jgi:hypothetical protein